MSEKRRLLLFLAGAAGVAAVYIAGILNMPPWGTYRGPYGDIIAGTAVFQRHATDVVNAITYDYRGFDTLGEEFILFSAVTGVALLLRPESEEKRRKSAEGENPASFRDRAALSETVQVFTTAMFGFSVLFGIYIGTHGQLTPGGGFQGGLIVAAAPMLLYVAENTEAFERIISHPIADFFESAGASAYALIGIGGLALGLPFLTNVLPLGITGDLFSSGTIALISACVGLEVAAAFMGLTYEYLREILSRSPARED
ncbi:MAG TPA: MnhB domain-containing protein [Acidobacteriaceae bacterium]|jgi:multicomponent Na+:H+ antiporter subunit B